MSGVTVGLPVYNEAQYVAAAIQSALDQTLPAEAILVFDNASTDGTEQIAAGLVGEAAVRQAAQNLGAVANFNRAVHESTTPYFCWLAADDLLEPDYLRATRAVLDSMPDVDAACTFMELFNDAGTIAFIGNSKLNSQDDRERIRSYVRQPRWTEVYCLYRREALLESPMFSDRYGSDVFLGWWFVLRGTIHVVEESLLRVRRDGRDRSSAAQAKALRPDAKRERLHKARMWRNLWRDAARAGVPRRITRIARQELLLAVFDKHWQYHFASDYLPYARGPVKRFIERLGRRAWPG